MDRQRIGSQRNRVDQAKRSRRGSSYLEVQVAMVLLAIGMAGLYSMSVVQTKQTARLKRILPADEIPAINRSADSWAQKLGVYAELEPAVVPTDPVLPYVYFEQVIDNADGPSSVKTFKDPGDTYGWVNWWYYRAFRGRVHYHRSYGNTGSYIEFRATGLPVGEYEVLTTYNVFGSLGTAIPHQVFDGRTLRSTVLVDQTEATSEVSYEGRLWDRLAVVQINTGTVRIRLNDGPGCSSYILGDAMLIRSARSLDLISVDETAGGGATAILEAPE